MFAIGVAGAKRKLNLQCCGLLQNRSKRIFSIGIAEIPRCILHGWTGCIKLVTPMVHGSGGHGRGGEEI